MNGMDPYNPANVVKFWPTDERRPDFVVKDLSDGSLVLKTGIPTAYPPMCFLLLAPLSVPPWRIAQPLWMVISLMAFALTALSLASLIGLHLYEKRTYLFLAVALALAPFHTGLATGSIAILSVGASAMAVWAAKHRWNLSAGALVALAVGLKPQIGLPFLVYYILRRRWSIVGVALLVVGILMGVTILRLTASHTPWLQNYEHDNEVLFTSGSLGDFTDKNPLRFGLVNLQVLLYTFVPNRSFVNALAFAVGAAMGLIWLLLARRYGNGQDEILELSTLLILSLLPIYHRLYDASLLIFPLAWSVATLSGHLKAFAKATLISILAFLIPGGSALEQLQQTSHFDAVLHSPWWTKFVMPYQIWILLGLSAVLLRAMLLSHNEAPYRLPNHAG
jgi:hypothetical protein